MQIITQIQFIDTFGQYGPQGLITVDPGTQFAIDYSIQDIVDPFARKGVKSYQFKIVGNKQTNDLLNYYYDINVQNGIYSVNTKQKVCIIRNGLVVADNLYMQLLQINKQNNQSPYSDDVVSYDVIVGDDVTGFFTKITNKYLTDLGFQDLNHQYNSANVVASFPYPAISPGTTPPTGGFKYVIPWTNNAFINLEECRPAISVYEYWDRIHKQAGYQWDWAGYNTDKFRMDKLWIPYNGDEPKFDAQALYKVEANTNATVPYTQTGTLGGAHPTIPGTLFSGQPAGILWQDIILDQETMDPNNDYNPTTGIYTIPFTTGTDNFEIQFIVSYEVNLINGTAQDAVITNYNASPSQMHYIPEIHIKNIATGADSICQIDNIILNSTVGVPYTVPAFSTVNIMTATTQTGVGAFPGVLGQTFKIQTGLDWTCNGMGAFVAYQPIWATLYSSPSTGWQPGPNPVLNVPETQMIITNIQMVIVPAVTSVGYQQEIQMNDFVPDKIKQSDFIKAVCNMYNLVMEPDPNNDHKIVYSTRDDFFDNGTLKDWTSKVDISKQQSLNFISNANSKKSILSYKADNDDPNTKYLGFTKEVYGQLEYTLDNNNIKDIDLKEVLFSPTPIAETPWGSYNPLLTGVAPKTNIRILLDGGVQYTDRMNPASTATYEIVDYYDSLGAAHGSGYINYYPMLTHFDNPKTPQFDINFGLNDYYYYTPQTRTNNNLFNMFWRRTMGQINTGKLWTTYLWLNEQDMQSFKLSDKIWIKDGYYNVNQLQYDPNSTGPTKVVFITVDDNLLIPPFRKTNNGDVPIGTTYGQFVTNQVLSALAWIRQDTLTNNYSPNPVIVLGDNNYIGPDVERTMVIGSHMRATQSDTLYVNNISMNGYITNTTGDITGPCWQYVNNNITVIPISDTQAFNVVMDSLITIVDPGIGGHFKNNLFTGSNNGYTVVSNLVSNNIFSGTFNTIICDTSGIGDNLMLGQFNNLTTTSTSTSGINMNIIYGTQVSVYDGGHGINFNLIGSSVSFVTDNGSSTGILNNTIFGFGNSIVADSGSFGLRYNHLGGTGNVITDTAGSNGIGTCIITGDTNIVTTVSGGNGINSTNIQGYNNIINDTNANIDVSGNSITGSDNIIDSINNTAIFGRAHTINTFSDSIIYGQSNTYDCSAAPSNNFFVGGMLGGSGIPETTYGKILYGGKTTNATLTTIYTGFSNSLYIPTNYCFRVELKALVIDQATLLATEFTGSGIITNNAGTTALAAAITMTPGVNQLSLSSANITISADNTNDALKVEVTGLAATNMTWAVDVDFIFCRL